MRRSHQKPTYRSREPTRRSRNRPSAENRETSRPRQGQIYTGVFQAGHKRGGFVVLETEGVGDVFVPNQHCATALHGDQVRVFVTGHSSRGLAEGKIERVLRHANRRIVGQIRRAGRMAIVTPKNPKINRLVEIHRPFSQEEAPDGAWVEVEIRIWSDSPHEPLVGSLLEVLGLAEDERIPILLLIREQGVRAEFPPEVEADAAKLLKRKIGAAEADRRRDFRSERVITIDPATAKDFDDAVSLVGKTAKGWKIAVHIADVAHYVRPGSKVDEEAYDRATSIYPVDRVVPMLPEALSNELCSLRPGEDKLTMSVIFEVGRDGAVGEIELCNSLIHSVRRFSYEEAQGLFDRNDGLSDSKHPAPEVTAAIEDDLLEIRAASRALLGARMRRGSLDLDLPETEITFDEHDIVADVSRKERLESHRLIEDLMIAANEAVARELTRRQIGFLYRVHEPPEQEKVRALAPALSRFGIALPDKGAIEQRHLQAAIEQAGRHPAGAIIQRWVLRAMERAEYRPANAGHFGLASDCYAHFTSPIRRYPDLVVHRAVKRALGAHDADPVDEEEWNGQLEQWGRHTSAREERAQRIEWDAIKILSLEFMRHRLGDVYEGFISGVTPKGFFVELVERPIEGFVPIRSLDDDYYDMDPARIAWYGRGSGKAYGVGDRITVQVERVDVLGGQMDFGLVRKNGGARGKREKSGPRRKPANRRKHVKRGRR